MTAGICVRAPGRFAKSDRDNCARNIAAIDDARLIALQHRVVGEHTREFQATVAAFLTDDR